MEYVKGPFYEPGNVYQTSLRLPDNMRCVAVLPLTAEAAIDSEEASTVSLESILRTELAKSQRFAVVSVFPQQLQRLSGRASWLATDPLPPELLQRLQNGTACDAVLFSQVTGYRPYPPVAIGWKLTLVSCPEGDILWSVDEYFDAAEPPVANAARRYFRDHRFSEVDVANSESMLASPTRFGHYAAQAVVATLPKR